MLSTVGQVARREGVTALYRCEHNGDMLGNVEMFIELCRGLVPGLQRQMAFSAIRIGLYENFKR